MGDLGLTSGLGRYPGEGNGYPLPLFWPGKFYGLYNPWGRKESDMTEQLSPSLHFYTTAPWGRFFIGCHCNTVGRPQGKHYSFHSVSAQVKWLAQGRDITCERWIQSLNLNLLVLAVIPPCWSAEGSQGAPELPLGKWGWRRKKTSGPGPLYHHLEHPE